MFHEFKPSIDMIVIKDKEVSGRSSSSPDSFYQKLSIASNIGFCGVELWHDDILMLEKAGVNPEEIQQSLQSLCLKPVSYKCLGRWFDITDEEFSKRIGSYHKQFEMCSRIQSSLIAMPIHRYNQKDRHIPNEKRRCQQLKQLADEYGVKVMIECNSLAKSHNTLNDAIRLSGFSGSSVVVDTFHLYHSDECNADFQQLNIGIIHLADAKPETTRGPRLFLGDGEVPIKKILNAVWSSGHAPPLSIGVYNRLHDKQTTEQIARIAYECFYTM